MSLSDFAALMLLPIAGFVTAYVVSSLAVPLLQHLPLHQSLVDYPDGKRHAHATPVARLGGVAVFAGFLAALGLFAVVARLSDKITLRLPQHTEELAAAAAILFIIGLLDDAHGVRPSVKLLAQGFAAIIVYQGGFRIDALIAPPDHAFTLGWLSLPVTVLWIVGVSNALNLVDGIDGLAGGVAVIALLATTVAATVLHHDGLSLHTMALMGALAAFLRFNVSPARIFLGDSGSLVVGFLLAVLTVKGATRIDGSVHMLAPIFALSYPLLDTGMSIMRRWLRGDPLSRADGRHIHHQLLALGLGAPRSTRIIWAESLAVAVLGLCVTFAPPAITVAVAGLGVTILLFVFVYGVRWLQYHEFLEAGASVASAARQGRGVIRDKIRARDVARQIASATSFEDVVTLVEDSAPAFRFARMSVRRASRDGTGSLGHVVEPMNLWRLEYPIPIETPMDPRAIAPHFLLTVSCPTTSAQRPAGAIRVAQILAPAVGRWIDTASVHDDAELLKMHVGARRDHGVSLASHPAADLKITNRLQS